MLRDAYIRTRTNTDLKARAEAVLEKLGLTLSEAINMYLIQIDKHQGIPFPVKVPNAETIAAMQESTEGLTSYATVDDLFKSWDEDLSAC